MLLGLTRASSAQAAPTAAKAPAAERPLRRCEQRDEYLQGDHCETRYEYAVDVRLDEEERRKKPQHSTTALVEAL